MSLRLAVFASGGGSNLQALIEWFNNSDNPYARVALVVSDRADAGALARARAAGVEAMHIQVNGRPPDLSTREMLAALEFADIDLIALAGYLRLVPTPVIKRYPNRIVNIHPAMLPQFGGKGMYGMNVHKAVIDSGAKVTGATVHFVNEHYDEGGVIAQWPVRVQSGDTPDQLAARVLNTEHVLYPACIELIARRLQGETIPDPTLAQEDGADTPTHETVRHHLHLN